ncbi:MAG: hypothetical protein CMJ31_00465 [Phycisphaerae bacterium]|nr:hypothetical protein [Phycisphaerae bacterium]
MKTALRNGLPVLALLLFGPLAALPVAGLRASDGSQDTTLLVGTSPIGGLIALVIGAVLAVVIGAFAARTLDLLRAMSIAGLTLAWPAIRTGDMRDILQRTGGGAIPLVLVEAILVAVVGLACFAVIRSFHTKKTSVRDIVTLVTPKNTLILVGAGTVGALIGSLVVAFDALPGQALLAAILGGAAAGAVVPLLASSIGAKDDIALAFAATLVAGVIAPVVMLVYPGLGGAADAARAHAIVGPLAVQPLMWLSGAFVGAPIGWGWAGATSSQINASPTVASS